MIHKEKRPERTASQAVKNNVSIALIISNYPKYVKYLPQYRQDEQRHKKPAPIPKLIARILTATERASFVHHTPVFADLTRFRFCAIL